MLAAIIERLAGLPRPPARAHGADIVFHPLRRLRPRHPKSPHQMTLHLRAETEYEPAPAHPLQIPCGVGGRDRAFGESQGDSGAKLDFRRLLSGNRKVEVRIVLRFDREDRVIAKRLGVAHLMTYRAPGGLWLLVALLHFRSVRDSMMKTAFDFYLGHAA